MHEVYFLSTTTLIDAWAFLALCTSRYYKLQVFPIKTCNPFLALEFAQWGVDFVSFWLRARNFPDFIIDLQYKITHFS